jgi:hypothetical protein
MARVYKNVFFVVKKASNVFCCKSFYIAGFVIRCNIDRIEGLATEAGSWNKTCSGTKLACFRETQKKNVYVTMYPAYVRLFQVYMLGSLFSAIVSNFRKKIVFFLTLNVTIPFMILSSSNLRQTANFPPIFWRKYFKSIKYNIVPRGWCYDQIVLRFSTILSVFLRNQCYDQKFCKISFCFESKMPIFSPKHFGENISKIITSVPGREHNFVSRSGLWILMWLLSARQ